MCRTVHAVLQTLICGIQMLVRVFMTIILMIENVIRMILQTLYNFISFMLQMISLIPICLVFLLTARLKCFMCGGGGACPVARGGACDCLMSLLGIILLFFIFRATGVLDKIFFSLGYSKYKPSALRFVPTPGDITECSRNDTTVSTTALTTTTEMTTTEDMYYDYTTGTTEDPYYDYFAKLKALSTTTKNVSTFSLNTAFPRGGRWPPAGYHPVGRRRFQKPTTKSTKWTTVVYYLI